MVLSAEKWIYQAHTGRASNNREQAGREKREEEDDGRNRNL